MTTLRPRLYAALPGAQWRWSELSDLQAGRLQSLIQAGAPG